MVSYESPNIRRVGEAVDEDGARVFLGQDTADLSFVEETDGAVKLEGPRHGYPNDMRRCPPYHIIHTAIYHCISKS